MERRAVLLPVCDVGVAGAGGADEGPGGAGLLWRTAGLYLLLTEDWRRWRALRPFSGVLLFLAIAAPWHVLAGLRNQGGADGHGFWWFYFWNEHVLRFLGRRVPRDYNKMPGWLYWAAHLVWLFPWALFLPLGVSALWRRNRHQENLARSLDVSRKRTFWANVKSLFLPLFAAIWVADRLTRGAGFPERVIVTLCLGVPALTAASRVGAGLEWTPFRRIDPQQKTVLLLALFAAVVLLFFSLSTNQEYYTFPAYLPLLLLIGATITRAEQTYPTNQGARRWVTFAHATFTAIGAVVALALLAALWASRDRPYVADLGGLLAHRSVGGYTLSMSHFFDLTTDAFAGLRFPALVAVVAFAAGPALAWVLRAQRRHLASTTAIALTSGLFLMAAHVALVRFSPMLSSEEMAATIVRLERQQAISPASEVLLYGDQAYGSSIPFYLGRQVGLVDGRSTSMLFGSTFADAPHVFESGEELARGWGNGERKVLFVPMEERDAVARLLAGKPQVVLREMSGKELLTDRGLEVR